jgi:PAS domain S-box-containing protein
MSVARSKTPGRERLTKKDLLAALDRLQTEVDGLRLEKEELELLLETTTDHSDALEEELQDKAEAALRESERRLRVIAEATPVAVLITQDSNGEIIYANAVAGPLIGLAHEALLGRRATDFFLDPDDQTELDRRLTSEGEVNHYGMQLRCVDGACRWVDVSLRRLVLNEQPCLLATWHDITRLMELNRASARFVPTEWLAFLQRDSIVDIALGDHFSKEMSVMFSDVRSFTTMSERMSPQESFDFVNAYLGRIGVAIGDHQGFIVKYLGDGVMAMFPERADDAVMAGIDMLGRVRDYCDHRMRKGRSPFEIGIAVNTGHMMVGMVGDRERMQGDAFSDDVNLTARAEDLTKFYGVSFIITEATYRRMSDPDAFRIRFLDRVQVRGRSEPLELYEVFDADPAEQLEHKDATRSLYHEAMECYYAQAFADAQGRLFDVLKQNPKDKVAWHHLVAATRMVEEGGGAEWTGVRDMA